MPIFGNNANNQQDNKGQEVEQKEVKASGTVTKKEYLSECAAKRKAEGEG